MAKKYDRVLEFIKFITASYAVLSFCYCWVLYYNDHAFPARWLQGAACSCVVYGVTYISLTRLYGAFRIGTCRIGELAFSQALAVGVSDLLLYVACCLVHGGYVDIIPGFITFTIQTAGLSLLLVWAKRYFAKHIPPQKGILVCGEGTRVQAEMLRGKLSGKLPDMLSIKRVWECGAEPDASNAGGVPETMTKGETPEPGAYAGGKTTGPGADAGSRTAGQEREGLEAALEGCDTVLLYKVPGRERGRILAYCTGHGKNVYVAPELDDIFLSGCKGRHLVDTPLLKYSVNRSGRREGYFSKRFWDVLLSLVFLILLSPVMALTALFIHLGDGGPVFFRQRRVTLHGREFDIIKFRSMRVDAERDGAVIPCTDRDPRVTRVGRIIRACRLDELPQLINILKGDMSIVGPRPERVEHVEKYTGELPEFTARLQVRGGLTGYAQVFGKYNTTAEDKLKLDLIYIENMSLWMDVKLLFLTAKVMFLPESTEGFAKEEGEGCTDASGSCAKARG